MAVLFISIDRMPFLVPTVDNADPFFGLVITSGSHLYQVEVWQIKTQLVGMIHTLCASDEIESKIDWQGYKTVLNCPILHLIGPWD